MYNVILAVLRLFATTVCAHEAPYTIESTRSFLQISNQLGNDIMLQAGTLAELNRRDEEGWMIALRMIISDIQNRVHLLYESYYFYNLIPADQKKPAARRILGYLKNEMQSYKFAFDQVNRAKSNLKFPYSADLAERMNYIVDTAVKMNLKAIDHLKSEIAAKEE